MNDNDRLLIVAKMIVLDMDEIARIGHSNEIPVYFGMGQALNRVYAVLRKLPMLEIRNIKPIDMMRWIREQPLHGLSKDDNIEDVLRKLTLQ